MFVGHYAAAMAAKAAEPRAPLWTYFLAAQLVDVGWSALVAAGVENVKVDASLPGSVLDLYHMPWTHSLPGAVLWAVAGAAGLAWILKLPLRAGVFLGLTIFSHWALDLLVHRPDLELWFGGPKVGLGLWNAPVVEQAVEMGLLGIAAIAWVAHRSRSGQAAWPAAALLAFLVFMQIGEVMSAPGGDAIGIGLSAFMIYALLTGAAALAELRAKRRPPGAPESSTPAAGLTGAGSSLARQV